MPGKGGEVQGGHVCLCVCVTVCAHRRRSAPAAVGAVIKTPPFVTGIRRCSHSHLWGEAKLLPVVLSTAILAKKILGGGNLCG